MIKAKPIDELFQAELEYDCEYKDWHNKMEALATFLVDYEFLKDTHKYTQEDVARRAFTNQSSISRLSRLKGKPTYDLLRRVSTAVGGTLFVTPLGEYSVTLNYEYFDIAKELAEKNSITVSDLLTQILNEYFEAIPSVESFQEFNYELSSSPKSLKKDLLNWEQDNIFVKTEDDSIMLKEFSSVVGF